MSTPEPREARDERFSEDPLAGDLRIVIGRLVRRLRSERRLGLTSAAVLARLEREGPQATGQLARAECVRPQSMSQTLAELEAEGLVGRRPDRSDMRRTLIELTAKGAEAIREERAIREGWLATALAEHFTARERELVAEAMPLLARLAEL